ncbi:MAG: hypothetical protein AAFO88_00830 [Pseudomonadota bacterium]
MTRSKSSKALWIVVMSATVLAMAGCSGGNDLPPTPIPSPPPPPPPPPPSPPPPPPPPPANPSGQLGAGFSISFDQPATAEPLDPAFGDVIAIDKTAEPLDVPE